MVPLGSYRLCLLNLSVGLNRELLRNILELGVNNNQLHYGDDRRVCYSYYSMNMKNLCGQLFKTGLSVTDRRRRSRSVK